MALNLNSITTVRLKFRIKENEFLRYEFMMSLDICLFEVYSKLELIKKYRKLSM